MVGGLFLTQGYVLAICHFFACLLIVFYIVGAIDCYASLAHVALYNDWVQPTMVPSRGMTTPTFSSISSATSGSSTSHNRTSSVGVIDTTIEASAPDVPPASSSALHIKQLRHPILESLLGTTHYVPSSLTLSDSYTACCLLTGPNMGGKSTFMRAVAICVLLAHMGSFVPAKEAIIPIFDKLYIRIGAADCSYTGKVPFGVVHTCANVLIITRPIHTMYCIYKRTTFCSTTYRRKYLHAGNVRRFCHIKKRHCKVACAYRRTR